MPGAILNKKGLTPQLDQIGPGLAVLVHGKRDVKRTVRKESGPGARNNGGQLLKKSHCQS